ncbi:MAG: beta-phosphoglucomutase family hydrolase [Chlorobiales bacterium]|nr:beta-phosphoglucomutase family hydrolase [Chlorobiales bacterium]
MDGVLVDNMKAHTDAWLELFRDRGFEIDMSAFIRKTAGMKAEEVVRLFLGSHISDGEALKISDQKDFLYRVMYRKQLRPLQGLLKFLDSAEKNGISMGVATGSSPENIEFVLGGLGLKRYFKRVVGAAEVQRGKPDPEIYLKVAAELDRSPEHCLVFEDAMSGLEAARRAGMKAIALTTSHSAGDFSGMPGIVHITPDFSSLTPDSVLLHLNGSHDFQSSHSRSK